MDIGDVPSSGDISREGRERQGACPPVEILIDGLRRVSGDEGACL